MTEARWRSGTNWKAVERGRDVIAEIETDKATMEVEAVDEGRLGKILVAEGTEGVAVNQPIAILLEEGEDESALEQAQSGAAKPSAEASAQEPQPEEPPAARSADGAGEAAAEKQGVTPPASQRPSAAPTAGAGGDRIFASPLARRMAEQAGLDLAQLKGSGPNGRIVKADIRRFVGGKAAAPAPTVKPHCPDRAGGAGPAKQSPSPGLNGRAAQQHTADDIGG